MYEKRFKWALAVSIVLFILMISFLIAFLVEITKTKDNESSSAKQFSICNSPACQTSAKYIKEAMDTSVNACDDFYKYACGNWIKNNAIPDDSGSNSVLEGTVQNFVSNHLKDLLVKNAEFLPDTSAVKKVMQLYKGCISIGSAEKSQLTELQDMIENLGGWPMITENWNSDLEWWKVVAVIQQMTGIGILLQTDIMVHPVDPSKYTIKLVPASTEQLQHFKEGRAETNALGYFEVFPCSLNSTFCHSHDIKQHLTDALKFEALFIQKLHGGQAVNPKAGGVLPQQDQVFRAPQMFKSQDVNIKDYFMPISQLSTRVQGVDWMEYLQIVLKGTNIPVAKDLEILTDTNLLNAAIAAITIPTPDFPFTPRTVQDYLMLMLVTNVGFYASKDIMDASLQLLSLRQSAKSPKDIKDYCVTIASSVMPWAAAHLWSKQIKDADIEYTKNLVFNMRDGAGQLLQINDWLDKETKEEALKKLNKMKFSVAYPDFVKNSTAVDKHYETVGTFSQGNLFKTVIDALKTNYQKKMNHFMSAVDRSNDWPKEVPMSVNAFYYASTNSFYINIGIMAHPLLQPNSLQAVNFAGIGSIIGHEMFHGFDATGSQFDENGAMRNWWTPNSKKAYNERMQCMIQQYSSITDQLTNQPLNGQLTLGENIADNGGLKAAYNGYKILVKNDIRLQGLETISGDQLFFIAASQVWCANMRLEYMILMLKDTHSPHQYRGQVPFGNSDEFMRAFHCNDNAKMRSLGKCVVF